MQSVDLPLDGGVAIGTGSAGVHAESKSFTVPVFANITDVNQGDKLVVDYPKTEKSEKKPLPPRTWRAGVSKNPARSSRK